VPRVCQLVGGGCGVCVGEAGVYSLVVASAAFKSTRTSITYISHNLFRFLLSTFRFRRQVGKSSTVIAATAAAVAVALVGWVGLVDGRRLRRNPDTGLYDMKLDHNDPTLAVWADSEDEMEHRSLNRSRRATNSCQNPGRKQTIKFDDHTAGTLKSPPCLCETLVGL
jgi:hypothetical protein